jgi:glycerophosphoryl diester phosphodiesterase
MIVGHRGAGKLAPENSVESLRKAVEIQLHAVEFDVQLTKDKKFVLAHDGFVEINGKLLEIGKHSQKTLIRKGLVSLEQALDILKHTIAIIDIKVWGSAQYLMECTQNRKQIIRFTGSYLPDIKLCKQNAPQNFAYISQNKNPFRAIKQADQINADGISLKWFLINPITHWQAKRRGLEIMLYTLNSRVIGRVIARLYPEVSICTDRPDRFIGKRYNW